MSIYLYGLLPRTIPTSPLQIELASYLSLFVNCLAKMKCMCLNFLFNFGIVQDKSAPSE